MFVPIIISLAKGIPVTPKQQAAPASRRATPSSSREGALAGRGPFFQQSLQ